MAPAKYLLLYETAKKSLDLTNANGTDTDISHLAEFVKAAISPGQTPLIRQN